MSGRLGFPARSWDRTRLQGCTSSKDQRSEFQPTSPTMALLHTPSVEQLAIPGVSVLIFFLAYTSQYLFYYVDPGPLTKGQALWFNGFVLGIWWCYDRACTVDPGPRGWVRKVGLAGDEDDGEDLILEKGKRWCRKCEAVKPPRAHHCRQCGRYVFSHQSPALQNAP